MPFSDDERLDATLRLEISRNFPSLSDEQLFEVLMALQGASAERIETIQVKHLFNGELSSENAVATCEVPGVGKGLLALTKHFLIVLHRNPDTGMVSTVTIPKKVVLSITASGFRQVGSRRVAPHYVALDWRVSLASDEGRPWSGFTVAGGKDDDRDIEGQLMRSLMPPSLD